jgi:hypothetical protein
MGNYASSEDVAHSGSSSGSSDGLAPSTAITAEQRPSYLVFVPHVSYKGNSFFLVKQSLSSGPPDISSAAGASSEYVTSATGVLPTSLGLDFVASVSTANLYEQRQEVKTWVVATVNAMIQSLRPYEDTKVVHSEYTLLAPITVSVANVADASTSSSYSVLTALFDWDIVEEPFELFAPGIGEPIAAALGGGSYCYRWVSLGQIARQMSTLAGAVGTNRCALHQLFGNEDFQTEALKSILGRALISSENDLELIDGNNDGNNNDGDEEGYKDEVREDSNDETNAIRPPPPDYEEDSEEEDIVDHQLSGNEEQELDYEEEEEEKEEEEDPRQYRRQRRVIAASHLKIPKSSVTLGREFYNSL